ncbi:MAG: ArnT family glycosyltransferase [Myxococcota bacterium]
MPRSALLILVALLALQTPGIARPPHYDEANFLVLAEGARADPWRPHDVRINWQGTEERAFDVLSNPPGIAWWLAPVGGLPIAVRRLWMLPWLGLALWGAWSLGKRFLGDAERGALLLLTTPVAFLATPSLLPDAPLYALTLAGVGGFVEAVDRERPAWPWALLAGCAALFRYSGLCLAPLLLSYGLMRARQPWAWIAALAPPALLALHDLHAYGEVHLLAMGGFQSVANTPLDWGHKFVAAIAMLGGAAAIPVFPWGGASAIGAAIGAASASPWGVVAAGFGALGGAALAAVPRGVGHLPRPARGVSLVGIPANTRDRLFLSAWAFGGLLFLLSLRFTAARYWLPFLPGVLLAFPSARWARVAVAVQLGLAVLLAVDDDRSARAQRELAQQVEKLGTGVFTGHWGWQWELERRGWRALDEGDHPPPGTLVAMAQQSWPQAVEVACNRVVWEGKARPPFPWLPRGYSAEARANLHANWIYGRPPVRTVLPWWFANDPYEGVRVCAE